MMCPSRLGDRGREGSSLLPNGAELPSCLLQALQMVGTSVKEQLVGAFALWCFLAAPLPYSSLYDMGLLRKWGPSHGTRGLL